MKHFFKILPVWAFLAPLAALAASPGPAQVTVACVGDSITFGAGLDPAQSYPQQLGGILGVAWEVHNFGHSGATLTNAGDLPYQKTAEFKAALAAKPNVVVIMLGTNDTKAKNWIHQGDYEKDYRDLVAKFQGLTSKPKIYLMLPPPVMGQNRYGIQDTPLSVEIPIIKRIAAETGASVIDIHGVLAGKPELFQDNVHPKAEGAKLIAQAVSEALTSKSETLFMFTPRMASPPYCPQ